MTEPKLALDLSKTTFTRSFGDIVVLGSWYGPKGEPCIVLMRSNYIGKENVTPCAILLRDAWKWSENGGDGAHCARTSFWFAEVLGLNTANTNSIMRVTSIIRECLEDLLKIAPKPEGDKVVVADVIRKDEYGKEHHTELVENV